MEFKMDGKIVEAAAKAPRVFVSASLGEGEEYNRETGIQLTKEQIISLRKYEVLGLSLPILLADVVSYLNYGAGDAGGVGLKAADFLRTFTYTYAHAKRWSPLREKIMLTGTDLKIFAGSIIRTGRGIVEIYEDLKASRYLEEYDINTPQEYLKLKLTLPNLPDLGLPSGDVPEIKAYLNDMLTKVKQCHEKAEDVRSELDSFGADMREIVLPEIRLRLEFVSRNTYQADIQALQNEIDQRSKEIDELNKQYDQLVQEAIKAAATLNIGGLILGIYQGVKAENIRQERNRLKAEQQASNLLMASKNQTLSSLNKVRDDLQNLSYVAIEAEVATQNLMLVWNALSTYISASVKEVESIEEATSLRKFKNQILGIIEPWEQIKTSSDQLLGVFAAADKEYGSSFTMFRSKAVSLSLINHPAASDFDVAALRAHAAAIQTSNVTARMLGAQFDYLPGTVRTMDGLAAAIQKATFELRNQAQTTGIHLERSLRKLEMAQGELRDYPEDADEIREEMGSELKNVATIVSEHADDLKVTHNGLSTAYDRLASARWIVTLQQDRSFTDTLKIKAEEKVVDLEEQMKSVSEAIDLLAKAGVEKFGQEAQLTLDNLKALGLAPPQVQVALLAIDTLKKLISGIGDAISYLNMLAAYNQLKDKAGGLRTQAKRHVNELAQIDGKISLVEVLDQLDEERWVYVNEFSSLVAVVESFARDFKQDTSQPVEQRTVAAIARVGDVVKYLTTIQS
ncbi:alpha-xenorhabdolysin family binary toxin subunit A [Pseudomonas sp. SWRI153]|uniref:Alpha-xenorhabdolysin family binary toxin subunit A n=1 Tax=Pseudomonas khorasanensis TaxID=2745508 RepID=A0A923JHK9_9PSED|nr:alpha-xenorhabdolysin family binary toxin subunit A [Pseudomonas khorasanensis]MBV4488041.1 alpha-xenorhabdolysin family binary toxin subunit A [Pseudomonas khorasanensis]